MSKHNQDGAINALLLPLIIASLLFVAALAFGFWAYGERSNYKNNSDQIVAQAVTVAKQQEAAVKAKEYAEVSKSPLKTYTGPSQFGSFVVKYPKTWSAYVDTNSGNSNNGLDAYFNPDTVPSVTDDNSSFALHIRVLSQPYSSTVQSFDGQSGVTIAPYALPKVPRTVGVRVTGQIEDNKKGDMVILPLRDSTLEIFTESQDSENDFNNSILPNFTFAP